MNRPKRPLRRVIIILLCVALPALGLFAHHETRRRSFSLTNSGAIDIDLSISHGTRPFPRVSRTMRVKPGETISSTYRGTATIAATPLAPAGNPITFSPDEDRTHYTLSYNADLSASLQAKVEAPDATQEKQK